MTHVRRDSRMTLVLTLVMTLVMTLLTTLVVTLLTRHVLRGRIESGEHPSRLNHILGAGTFPRNFCWVHLAENLSQPNHGGGCRVSPTFVTVVCRLKYLVWLVRHSSRCLSLSSQSVSRSVQPQTANSVTQLASSPVVSE